MQKTEALRLAASIEAFCKDEEATSITVTSTGDDMRVVIHVLDRYTAASYLKGLLEGIEELA